MAIDENKKKAIKDSEESVKDEEAEKDLISEEEPELSEEDAEDSDEETESEVEDEEEEESDSTPKSKKDRVPAIMIALIYLVIVAVALYYILPPVFAPSFGYTLEEFNAKLSESDIEKTMNRNHNSLIPVAYKSVDKNSIKEIWGIKGEIAPEEQKKIDARFNPFVKTYAATEELGDILVEANTRKNDGQLTRMCIYCVYSNENMSKMLTHFGAVLQNFFDDVTINEAIMMVLATNSENLYTVRNGIAYKVSLDNVGGKQTYIKLEVLPAKALKSDQILPSEKTAASAASETTAATPAA